MLLTASCITWHTIFSSISGGNERRTSCTPPTACLALCSALMAPCVEVAGTVQYTSPLSCPKLTQGLNSSCLQSKSTNRCASAAFMSSVAPAGLGKLNENVEDVNPCACAKILEDRIGKFLGFVCSYRVFGRNKSQHHILCRVLFDSFAKAFSNQSCHVVCSFTTKFNPMVISGQQKKLIRFCGCIQQGGDAS